MMASAQSISQIPGYKATLSADKLFTDFYTSPWSWNNLQKPEVGVWDSLKDESTLVANSKELFFLKNTEALLRQITVDRLKRSKLYHAAILDYYPNHEAHPIDLATVTVTDIALLEFQQVVGYLLRDAVDKNRMHESMDFESFWHNLGSICESFCRNQMSVITSDDGTIVGYLTKEIVDGESNLEIFEIFKPFRGKGIGSYIVQTHLDNISKIMVTETSIPFWTRLGYTRADEMYYRR
jgi:GNAT superfamily N-acetyltransferase